MLKSHNHPLGVQNKEKSVKPNHGRNPNPKPGDQEQAARGPAMGKRKDEEYTMTETQKKQEPTEWTGVCKKTKTWRMKLPWV